MQAQSLTRSAAGIRLAGLLAAAGAGCWAEASAQEPPFEVVQRILKRHSDAFLGIMAFQVTPDVTASSLSVRHSDTGNPSLDMFSTGAGFTWSDSFPLYMEGNISGARYDPAFVASNGTETRSLPLKWDSAAISVGIGWDFRLTDHLVLRPVLNGAVATLVSDIRIVQFKANDVLGTDIRWLNGKTLKATGYGGSLILDYEYYVPDYEIDVELRYTYMQLRTFDTEGPLRGKGETNNLNLWTRWRAPISDWQAFGNPVRYVLEATHTEFLGEQRGSLGFDSLTSLGLGLELEPGWLFDRTRVMGRYVFGDNVSGFSVGFAVTF